MAEESKEDNKSALLNPPKPPTKKEMSAREKRVASHAARKQRKSVSERIKGFGLALGMLLIVLIITELIIFSSPYLRSPLKDWVMSIKDQVTNTQEAKQLAKDFNKKTGEQLIPSGAVADGKLVATITGEPIVKDATVSFTVEWENKGSDSTYVPSDFVVDQGSFRNSGKEVYFKGYRLEPKEGYYNKVILPSQKKRVTYTYNLHDKKDDVRVIIGKVATKGIINNADEDSSPKLVGIVIKVRGE